MSWINGYQVWLTEPQSLQNAQKVVDFLYTDVKDWSKESIAALVGNMRHESSVNPNMYEYGKAWEDNRGFGLVQWTPRSKFWDWGGALGYTEADLRSGDSQLARMEYEVENNIQYLANGHQRRYGKGTKYNFSFADFRANMPQLNVNQLTEAFMWNYEGPNYTAGANSLAARQAFANKAYAELDWTRGGTIADTDPEPTPPPQPEPTPENDPDEPLDAMVGIDLLTFIQELNDKVNNMLTADIYKVGSSDYYKNEYLKLTQQLTNMYKIKANTNFFQVISQHFGNFNESYIPAPDPNAPPPPVPEPAPDVKMFPLRIENGVNFFVRDDWGVGTLQRNMTYGVRSTGADHFGYDIGGGGVKHTVYSVTSGTVVRANYANGIGNRMTIDNDGDKYFLEYGHLDSFIAKVGDKVTAGDPIAVMGQTGGNYAIHLDIKIATSISGFYSWDTTIDPEKYLGVVSDNQTSLSQP